MDSDKFCFSILSKYPIITGLNGDIGLVGFLFGSLYIFNTCLTIYWILHQRTSAELGVERAARHVVFPAYVPFMWASALSDFFYAGVFFFAPIDLYDSNPWSTAILHTLAWTFQEIVIEGVAFLLMQYGCGNEAAKRAGFYSFLWGIITFLVTLYFLKFGNSIGAGIVGLVYLVVILIFYIVLWVTPEGKLFRRDALCSYARFWSIYRLLALVSSCLLVGNVSENLGDCFYFFGPILFYILCKPYVIYWALLSDSIWWQGVYANRPMRGAGRLLQRQNKSEYATNKQNLVSPLFGIEVAFNDAQELGRQVDVMGSEGRVKLLNFAYLSLDKKKLLGCGSYSKVYRGKYRGTPVAIKLLFTVDLNPDIIRRCCSEAQLLSDISHPNVVEIFGVSVLPPSICIVLEICQYGSLSDVIRGSSGGGVARRPLPLCHADRMYLALGCARGLQALHNHIPALCHRDVKSFNFLVDAQLNAKIADLELGGDEAGVKDEEANRTSFNRPSSGHLDDSILNKRNSFKRRNKSSTRGETFLSTWLAPEVLMGCPHSLHSDIYSLGLVLWEIISTTTPFSEIQNPDAVKVAIIDGKRPNLPSKFPDKRYLKLIESCWSSDFSKRPVISDVVTALELCWEGSLHRYIFSTNAFVDMDVIKSAYDAECERLEYVQSMAVSFGRVSSSAGSLYSSNTPRSSLHTPSRRKSSFQHRPSMSGSVWGNRVPFSDSLIKALEPLKNESKLENLDSKCDASYMILSPTFPFIVLWVGKRWPQITGFFLSDIQCADMSLLYGPRTDSASIRLMLESIEKGKPSHKLVTLYRRDGTSYIASLHGFPIFVKFPGDNRAESDTIELNSVVFEEYISNSNYKSHNNNTNNNSNNNDNDNDNNYNNKHDEKENEDNRFNTSVLDTSNPLIGQVSSSSGASVNGIEITPSPSTDIIMNRSRNLSTMSLPYPSSEIPNKVAYIAVQISSIQDLRS